MMTIVTKQNQVRAAIYTRSAVNNPEKLAVQRMACESFIQNRRRFGWILSPKKYDDDGKSGARIARSGLKKLLKDVRSGKIGAVVCYDHTRLSRSLEDMIDLTTEFKKREVTFARVAGNQNVLMSFDKTIARVYQDYIQRRSKDCHKRLSC